MYFGKEEKDLGVVFIGNDYLIRVVCCFFFFFGGGGGVVVRVEGYKQGRREYNQYSQAWGCMNNVTSYTLVSLMLNYRANNTTFAD